MSSFIFENGNIIEFNSYCLSESIKPKKVNFGCNIPDFNNETFYSLEGDSVIGTSFYFKEIVYTVSYFKGEIGFHISDESHISNYKEFMLSNKKQTIASNAILVFSNILYIIIEMTNKFNLSEIRFQGENNKLDKMYSNLIKNKIFISELNKIGFQLVLDTKFTFRKQQMQQIQQNGYRGYLQEINESLLDSVKEKFKGVIDKLPKGFDYNITINGMQISKDKVNLVFIDKKNIDKADEMIKKAVELSKEAKKSPEFRNMGDLDWEKHKDFTRKTR